MAQLDLGPANAIIQAFQFGHQMAEEKAKRAQQKEQFDKTQELANKQLEQKRKQEEDELAQRHELESKHLDLLTKANELNQLIQGAQFAQKYQETGITPPGATIQKPEVSTPINMPSGQVQTQNQPISQTLGLGVNEQRLNIPGIGESTVLNPEAAARRAGELGILREAPALKKQQELLDLQERNKKEIEQMHLDASEIARQREDAARINLAHINGDYRILAAQISANKVQSKDLDKLTELQDLKKTAEETRDLLDKYGWDKYFKGGGFGIVGGLTEFKTNMAGGAEDPVSSDIRTRLGKIADKQKKLLEGSVLSKSEEPYLTSHVPSFQRNQNATAAKAKLENFIADQDYLIKANKVNQQKPEAPTNAKEGKIVNISGKKIRITRIYPNGRFDGEEVK